MAAVVADTSLTGLPEGKVTSRADALRVTEAIELLLDACDGSPPTTCTRPAVTMARFG